jgi:hypothetical protein
MPEREPKEETGHRATQETTERNPALFGRNGMRGNGVVRLVNQVVIPVFQVMDAIPRIAEQKVQELRVPAAGCGLWVHGFS